MLHEPPSLDLRDLRVSGQTPAPWPCTCAVVRFHPCRSQGAHCESSSGQWTEKGRIAPLTRETWPLTRRSPTMEFPKSSQKKEETLRLDEQRSRFNFLSPSLLAQSCHSQVGVCVHDVAQHRERFCLPSVRDRATVALMRRSFGHCFVMRWKPTFCHMREHRVLSFCHMVALGVAHKSLKPTINTLEHGVDLRSV